MWAPHLGGDLLVNIFVVVVLFFIFAPLGSSNRRRDVPWWLGKWTDVSPDDFLCPRNTVLCVYHLDDNKTLRIKIILHLLFTNSQLSADLLSYFISVFPEELQPLLLNDCAT